MKKIFVLIMFLIGAPVFCEEISPEIFFNNYVKAANSYSKNLTDFYLKDARIIRVVIKPDGCEQAVNFSMERYKKEMFKGQKLARLTRYKNVYSNKNFEKLEDGDYKISAQRTPSGDKKSLPCYFILTKTQAGWKIKEESMHTKVQKFLAAK